LYLKSSEAALQGMPAALVVSWYRRTCEVHQPLHAPTEIANPMRPQQQLEMDVHQTKPSQTHQHFSMSLPHQLDKCGEVIVIMKTTTCMQTDDEAPKLTSA
jgi:hypothetical protein